MRLSEIEQKNLETGYYDHLVIAPYPSRYISEWRTKDGEIVILRPIKSEDEILFNRLFNSLSPETKRFRFFELINELSHEKLARFCNLDNDREIAIIAELQKGERTIIGVGRLIIDLGGNDGEFAVIVSDQRQGQGLGSKLMNSLIEIAQDMGVTKIYGYVIANNYKMLSICRKKGFKTETLDDDTVLVTKILG